MGELLFFCVYLHVYAFCSVATMTCKNALLRCFDYDTLQCELICGFTAF